jgi:antitoxin VapB
MSVSIRVERSRDVIMLSIRDEEVRTLAETVMSRCGAPNLTAAIKLALQNEIRRADAAIPLAERVAAIRSEALAKAKYPPQPKLTDAERDALWGP